MTLNDLQTPSLILDEQILLSNLTRMIDIANYHNVTLRPHGKTAKNIDIVKLALLNQNKCLTASTLKEVEYYFKHGIKDIIYAVALSPNKLERVEALLKIGCDLKVVIDSVEMVKIMGEFADKFKIDFKFLIEIDSDGHRSGVAPHSKNLINIARNSTDFLHLKYCGIITHAGESYNSKSIEGISKIANQEAEAARKSAELLDKNGFASEIVSIGSTPTATFASNLEGITEIRAGVYMFNDLVMKNLEVCKLEDIALSVLTTVIGHQKEKGWIITDSGWMALSRDRGTANQVVDYGYGQVCNLFGKAIPNLIVSSTNQEHGIISSPNNAPIDFNKFPIGTLLRILPNHACATAACFDRYFVVANRTDIEKVWKRINGWI